MNSDEQFKEKISKLRLIELVNENVTPRFLNKFIKGNLFRWPFFLLSCYKIKICQKDTVENHLKIQVLLKSQN